MGNRKGFSRAMRRKQVYQETHVGHMSAVICAPSSVQTKVGVVAKLNRAK